MAIHTEMNLFSYSRTQSGDADFEKNSRKRKAESSLCEEADYKGIDEAAFERAARKKAAKADDFAHATNFQGELVDRFVNPPPNLLDLPCEILGRIFEFSCPLSLLVTNKSLKKIVEDERLFQWNCIESSKKFWVDHWIDVLGIRREASIESRFQGLFSSLRIHAGQQRAARWEIPHAISHVLSLSNEVERQEEISLLAIWPNMRKALAEAADPQQAPAATLPQIFAEAGEIRAWLADEKNRPLISLVTELNLQGSSSFRNGVELTGTLIPREIRRFSNLEKLSLVGHKIRYAAEVNFSGLSRLATLKISEAYLNGKLPKFFKMETLPSLNSLFFQ